MRWQETAYLSKLYPKCTRSSEDAQQQMGVAQSAEGRHAQLSSAARRHASFTVSEKGGKGCWDMNAPGSLLPVSIGGNPQVTASIPKGMCTIHAHAELPTSAAFTV